MKNRDPIPPSSTPNSTGQPRGPDGRRPRGRPAAIDQAQIVEAAIRVAKRVGVGSLTMQAVADEFGMTAMAVYYHIPTKHALLNLIADATFATVELPESDQPWDVQIYQVALRAWAAVREVPGLREFVLSDNTIGVTPAARRLADASLAALIGAGFDRPTATKALVTARVFSSMEAPKRSPVRVPSAPVVTTPVFDSAVDELDRVSPDEVFEFAMNCVLNGFKAMLVEPKST